MTPKICLNMIVKNEAKNLPRLFDSIKHIIDDYVIIDTGSTDNTKQTIKEYWNKLNIKGVIETIPFKNFGYNRSEGLKIAREKSDSNYILLLDADMTIVDNGFQKNQLIGKEVLMLKQKNQHIEWSNVRIIKKEIPATCIGVTHEYYDTKTAKCEDLNTLYINDIGDGGCKEDKYERDIRLLTEGLEKEPNNNRYCFYLAQSYRDTNNIDKAIEYYKKHILMPGWEEEIWYSHYMISGLYLRKNMIKEAEEWAMKGYSFRPIRAEAIYQLCKFFREKGQYRKAFGYLNLANSLPIPKEDRLFVEYKIYHAELEFENSIINYYLPELDKGKGLQSCLNIINKNFQDSREELVLKNMNFYIQPLNKTNHFNKIPFSKDHIINNDIKYNFSSPSIYEDEEYNICNIRCVSYFLTNNPMIFHNDKENLIQTKNICFDLKDNSYIPMEEFILNKNKHEKTNGYIRGLEDVRLFKFKNKIKFIGQSGDYKNINSKIRFNMVVGEYDIKNHKMIIEQILESPYNCSVEKNWVHLNDDLFIYKWFPLEIGKLKDTQFELVSSIETPSLFKYLKGSSNGFYYKNMYWFLTHHTTDDWKDGRLWRQYKHSFVVLGKDYKPIAYTDPFTFEEEIVAYSLGIKIKNGKIIFGYSKDERNATLAELDLEYIFSKFNYIDSLSFYKNLNI